MDEKVYNGLERPWKTIAYWPDGKISEDRHIDEKSAESVKRALLTKGNSLGKPLSVEVKKIG